MKVVILCGGKGTRLREETEYRPKPMIPIGNRPILWHIMKTYASHGYKEFVLCLGYKGEMIKDYFRNYMWMTSDVTLKLGRTPSNKFHTSHEEEDWSVTLADTGQETGTGGRIKKIESYLGTDENFFITYGDGVGNIDIKASLAYHIKHKKLLTLTSVRLPGRFGELAISTDGQIERFAEKPPVSEGRINGGYFIASKEIFKYLDPDPKHMFEKEPILKLIQDKQLMAYNHDGFWQPMDNYFEYTLLNQLWADEKAPWKIW
ncbi:MAG: glucose-1-phosphate cytidylyltransferase [Verrucomicrobiota bacterium]|nr:glucose-1-phosphate cytidylyltransferase [Verrucomicrobiota bacterium]